MGLTKFEKHHQKNYFFDALLICFHYKVTIQYNLKFWYALIHGHIKNISPIYVQTAELKGRPLHE